MKIEDEQKLSVFVQAISTNTAEEVMVRYREVENSKKELSERIEFVDALLAAMEQRLSDFLLETQQEGTITSNGTIKRVVKETFYVADKPAFRDWATNNGHEDMLSVSVTQQAVNEYYNSQYQDYLKRQAEARDQGMDIPPFEFNMPVGLDKKQKIKLSITKK